jgi:hypothetical protein
MNITAETLGMKITQLKSMVAECPVEAQVVTQYSSDNFMVLYNICYLCLIMV